MLLPPAKYQTRTQAQAAWGNVKNKRFVVGSLAGVVAVVTLSSAVLDTAERIPFLPEILTLLGLSYTTVFFWR